MAETYNTYTTTNSTTTDFVYTFSTISTAHTKVSVNGVVQTTGYSLLGSGGSGSPSTETGGMVRFDSAVANGAVVTVYRETPIVSEGLPVDFVDGSILTEADLDKNFNSLLYAAQEEVEDAGITLDPSYANWDAENKKITGGIAGTSSTDFVTVQQLEQVELYGPQAAPQGWAFTTTSAAQTVFVLDSTSGTGGSDLPTSTNENLYIVEVGGVIQRATTDFTVALDTDGQYKLTLTSGLDEANVPVIVRNFGVSRQIVEQPLIPNDTSSVGLKINSNSGQTEDLFQINESDGTTQLLAVEHDGDLLVGTDTLATNTRINHERVEVGLVDASSTTHSGSVMFHVGQDGTEGRPTISTQATSAADATHPAFQVYHGDNRKLMINYEGDVSCTDVTASGNITATGDVTCDDLTANSTVKVGGGFGNTGCTIDSGGKIETNSHIVADHISVSEGTGNGIQSTEYNGYIQFTDSGPALVHSTSSPYVKAMSNRILIHNGSDSTGTQLDGVKAPTSDLHAANKAYADTGRWLLAASITLDTTADWQDLGSGYGSYDRIRIEFDSVLINGGDTSSYFWIRAKDSSGTRVEFDETELNDYNSGRVVVESYGDARSQATNFTTNPFSGSLELSHHSSTSRGCVMDTKVHHKDFGSSDWFLGIIMGESTGTAAIDCLSFAAGDGGNEPTHVGFSSGTVKVYTFKYPTS